MKQTNNAIKFLLAQYRAIFKHAYLKGLASAVMLTTALAAGSTANAAISSDFGNGYDSLPDVTITENSNTISSDTTKYAKDVTLSENSSLSVSGSLINTGILTVGSSATLIVSGNINSKLAGDAASDWTGELHVSGGTLNVSGKIQTSDVNLTNAKVTIGTNTISTNAHNAGAYIIGGFGVGDNNVTAAQNSTITFNGYGFLQSNDALLVSDSTLNFNGTDTSNVEEAVNEADNFESAFIRGRDGVEITNSNIVVSGSRQGGIYGPTATISGGSITVSGSGTFTMDGDWNGFNTINSGTGDKFSHTSGDFTLTNVSVTNSGNIVLGNASEPSTFNISGNTGSFANAGVLTINAQANFGSTLSNTGEIIVNKGGLTTTANSLGVLDSGSGKVNVASGTTLTLTDTAITFSEEDFADNRDISVTNNAYGSGNIFNAGTIDASKAAVTIKSNDDHETNGGNKQTNILFMAGGELKVGSLDVEQKQFTYRELL